MRREEREQAALAWVRPYRLSDHLVRTRDWEWRQAQLAVTDWELKRYFEII